MSGALSHDLDESQALLADSLFDGLNTLLGMHRGPAGHVTCASGNGQFAKIKSILHVPVRGSSRWDSAGSRWGRLPPRHPVEAVVHTYQGHVQVTAADMDKVVPADGRYISIPGEDDGFQLWAGQKRARSHRRRPAVERPDGIEAHVMGRQTGRASHPGGKEKALAGYAVFLHEVIHCFQGVVQYLADAASWTKDGRKPVSVHTGLLQVLQHGVFHFYPFDPRITQSVKIKESTVDSPQPTLPQSKTVDCRPWTMDSFSKDLFNLSDDLIGGMQLSQAGNGDKLLNPVS